MNDVFILPENLTERGQELAEGQWKPYCEDIQDPFVRGTTAILMENMRRFFDRLDETTRILNIGNFDKFAFPLVKAIFPHLITQEIVSVQPMAGPSSIIFYLDFLYGTGKGSIASGSNAFDAIAGPTDNRFYSSDDISQQDVGDGDGATLAPTLDALNFTPVRQGSVIITATIAASAVQLFDDGSGNLVDVTGAHTGTVNYATGALAITFGTAPDASTQIFADYRYDSEANDQIPEMDLQLTSSPVQARSRKLRMRWSLEAAQNLQALHGIEAEGELVAATAEQIKFEIDREVINDLHRIALAGHVQWPVTVPTGISFTEHKLSIIDALIEGSNLIFDATKRAQANFLILSTGVANIIESQPTFVPEGGALQTQSTTGVVKIGMLNNRWTCYKDPFLGKGLTNPKIWIQGFKGSTFLDAGYVYAPYIPLYSTPTIVLDDFVGRKGLATQYGKRAVNARMYGTGAII